MESFWVSRQGAVTAGMAARLANWSGVSLKHASAMLGSGVYDEQSWSRIWAERAEGEGGMEQAFRS